MIRVGLVVAFAALVACNVNDYCLNCAIGDGGPGDGGDGGGGSDAVDAPDANPCVPTGVEICDGIDNDCDGQIDNGTLPGVGVACANQVGECAGGKQQCVAGALKCDKPPMPEICDLKDNNCNGMTDEGDPGGGGSCGTNVGECTAGVKHCNLTTGVVECQGAIGTVGGQPEDCNGRDDDCDGSFDEDLPPLGSCGMYTMGICHTGTFVCIGGGKVCMGDQSPLFETCDNLDNDCDGSIDEDYDKNTDPQNCGTCGHVCVADHAISGCASGTCTIASCQSGFHDNNNDVTDGCEYGPCQPDGAEVCDGVDNDCDGMVDNGLTPPPGLCKTAGACTGSFAMCSGAGGWKCVYPSGDASTDVNGDLVAETKCDGIDNDCDTLIDENQPNKGTACHDAGLGVCQGTGTFTCDASNLDGPAVCDITTPGTTASPEQCDGKDNDCDGIVDNTSGPNRVIDSMSHVMYGAFDFYIDTYEASRPDASASATGTLASRACSNPSVIPWSNVSWTAAQAACQAAGKVLCTGVQWGAACEGATNTTYPYGNAFNGTACNTESYDGIPGGADDDVEIATGALATCTAAAGARDLSGNLREWTNDKTGTTTGGLDIDVLRGGSYLTPAVGATCDFRTSRAAVNVLEDENGFRCCRLTAP